MTIADLYEQFEAGLHSYAVRLAKDPHRADDLVQETFIRTMGHLALLGQLNPFQQRSWLFRTLKNLFLDEELARSRQEALVESLAYEIPTASYPQESVILPNLFDLVPDQYRQVVEMRYIQGMNSREIAEELEIPAATVRSRLHLAMKKLRAQKTKLR